MTMTEQEKMLAGKLYDAATPELLAIRVKAHNLSKEYNGKFVGNIRNFD